MQYHSTREPEVYVSASQAIKQGLSPEGGLFVPAEFPKVNLAELRGMTYPQLASHIIGQFLTDYPADFLDQAVAKAYGENFQGRTAELHTVSEGVYSLELWHGPTCAFKDYALQLMPQLLVQAKRNMGCDEETLILVATSGDTGKAALAGYQDVPGVRIAVFYPNSGTSEIQRLQMSTQEGENVAVYAVQGNFDDAQTGVKRVFGDAAVNEELETRGVKLSSANSINWGRLVPQIVYYFAAYLKLAEQGDVQCGAPVDFCVPTGNFGDILAGYYAKQMGLPVGRLVCASNKNDVLTEFLTTGVYNANREFYKTSSPSMDILVSSNLERLLYHVAKDAEPVKNWMKELAREGQYTVSKDVLACIQQDFAAGSASDVEAAAELRNRWEKDGYLCDPHTAVAFKAARDYRASAGTATPMVVLSTASPYKFPRDVLAALGQSVPQDEFEAMARLEEVSGISAPQSLRTLRQKTERFSQVIEPVEIADVALGTK